MMKEYKQELCTRQMAVQPLITKHPRYRGRFTYHVLPVGNYPVSGRFDQPFRSNRSSVIILLQAATKSLTNLSFSEA